MQRSVTAKSRSSHASAEAKWRAFCAIAAVSVEAFPTEDEMCMFVAWAKSPADEGGGGIQGSSIALYLSGIRWLFISQGRPDPTLDRPRLDLVLQAAKKTDVKKDPRRPMTVELLQEARKFLQPESSFKDALCWLAMVFGVVGLFRLGELVPSSKSGQNHSFIRPQDVVVQGESVSVHLRSSKTDTGHQGVDIVMDAFPNTHVLSPAMALACVYKWRTRLHFDDSAPLFTGEDGRTTTYSEVVDAMNRSVSAVDAARGIRFGGRMYGHSLRRGGATSLARAGVSDAVIQGLGRWKSSAYTLYIQMDPHLRRKAYARLAMASPSLASLVAVPWSMDVDDSGTGLGPTRGSGSRLGVTPSGAGRVAASGVHSFTNVAHKHSFSNVAHKHSFSNVGPGRSGVVPDVAGLRARAEHMLAGARRTLTDVHSRQLHWSTHVPFVRPGVAAAGLRSGHSGLHSGKHSGRHEAFPHRSSTNGLSGGTVSDDGDSMDLGEVLTPAPVAFPEAAAVRRMPEARGLFGSLRRGWHGGLHSGWHSRWHSGRPRQLGTRRPGLGEDALALFAGGVSGDGGLPDLGEVLIPAPATIHEIASAGVSTIRHGRRRSPSVPSGPLQASSSPPITRAAAPTGTYSYPPPRSGRRQSSRLELKPCAVFRTA